MTGSVAVSKDGLQYRFVIPGTSGPARAGAIIPLQGPPADPAPCPQVIPRLFDTTQEARVTFETVFEPVLVSLEARPACHGAKGSLQRRLRCRGRRSVG